MPVKRWSAKKNIQFIEIYKQYECLWNPRHVEYKHQRVRDMAYEEIRKAMGMDSVKEVITRIRILRNTQNTEMSKAKKNEHYVSKISWLRHMDFIRNIVRMAERGKDETQDLHRSDTVSSEEESRNSLVQESYRSNSNRIYNNAEDIMLLELSRRWTVEKSIEFLQIYKKFECLWNPKHERYKNQISRNHAYNEIMKVMGMDSVKVVKAKIRSLRSTHYHETLKAKKNSNYISKISWVPHLDFINDVCVIDRKLVTPTTQEDTHDSYHPDSGSSEKSSLMDLPDEKRIKLEDPLDQESEESYFQEKESNLIDPSVEKRIKFEDPLDQESEESYFQGKESNLIDPSVEKRKQLENPLVQEIEESHLQEMVSLASSKDNDEFGLFGQTVAEQLRQLPLKVALETEEMILSTIRSQRIKILASTSSQIVNFPMKQELD